MGLLCCVLVPCTLCLTLALSSRQAPEQRQPGTPSQEQEKARVASATLDRPCLSAWPQHITGGPEESAVHHGTLA